MSRATYSGQVLTTKDGAIINQKNLSGTMETKLPLGNARAKAGQTRGFKHWAATRDGGVSVEATVMMQVTCGQSAKAMDEAAEVCGRLAEKVALRGLSEMDEHIHDFMRTLIGEE